MAPAAFLLLLVPGPSLLLLCWMMDGSCPFSRAVSRPRPGYPGSHTPHTQTSVLLGIGSSFLGTHHTCHCAASFALPPQPAAWDGTVPAPVTATPQPPAPWLHMVGAP